VTIQRSQPLPECTSCGRPTKRDVHARSGGLCTRCRALRPAWVPTPQEADFIEWQELTAQRGRQERDELAARRARKEAHRAR
jgi:recombinational DNA repair protein (RecF pathway)